MIYRPPCAEDPKLMMKPASALGTAASACVTRTAARTVEADPHGHAADDGHGGHLVSDVVVILSGQESLIRGLIGTGNEEIVRLAVMNLCIKAPLYFPEGVLVTMRQAMQGLGMKVVPVLASSIELVMKLLCAWLVVPVWGYRGASWGEPSTWAVCAVFITAVYFISRKKMYPDIS